MKIAGRFGYRPVPKGRLVSCEELRNTRVARCPYARGTAGGILQFGLLSFCLAFLAAACQSPGGFARDDIVQLNLISAPVALDFDGQPGPDGISVKVYANSATEPKPVPIRAGTLELLLFDGPFRQQYTPPVLKTFRFTAGELRAHESRASIGTGYAFALAWGANLPTQHTMSVAARYTGPNGKIVLSRPSSITVLSQ